MIGFLKQRKLRKQLKEYLHAARHARHMREDIADPKDLAALSRFREFFRCRDDIHMFLTSHFCYPPGTRIITFSKKKPLIIMYKEIEPLALTVM